VPVTWMFGHGGAAVLTFPSVSAWLWAADHPLMIAAAVFWLGVWVVLALRLWWKWRRLSRREWRDAVLVLTLLPVPLAVGGALFGRDVGVLQSWPFDPEAVESVVVEVDVDYRRVGFYRFEGGREVSEGLRLLDQSGECFSYKAQQALPHQTHMRYKVLIQLRGESSPSRFVEAFPRTQHGGPAVAPGVVGSHTGFDLYANEAFVRWLESLVERAAPAEPGGAPDRGGMR
jgi:hypothetical protein